MADAELGALLEPHKSTLKDEALIGQALIQLVRVRATTTTRVWIADQTVRGAGSVGIDLG